MTIRTYKSVNLQTEEDNEFQNCLAETKKILPKTYNRLVFRGKRGRGVPILLSSQMKTHFDMLLKVREHFVCSKDFVIHISSTSGTKILQEYVQNSATSHIGHRSLKTFSYHYSTIAVFK